MDINCTVSEELIKIFNSVEAGAAILSIIGCVMIVAHSIIFKRYVESTHKLLLFLVIAVFLNSTNSVIRGIGACYNLVGETGFCAGVAFLSSYTSGSILIAVYCIIAELFCKIVLNKTPKKIIQALYFLLIFVLPLLVFILPFINGNYGQSGPTCWIRVLNYTDCKENSGGILEALILWDIPICVGLFGGGILYIIALITFKRKLKNYTERYSSEKDRLIRHKALEEIRQFRWYPLFFFLINIPPAVSRITENYVHDLPFTLLIIIWVITALINGLQGIMVAMAFTMDNTTRRTLTYNHIYSAWKRNWRNQPDYGSSLIHDTDDDCGSSLISNDGFYVIDLNKSYSKK